MLDELKRNLKINLHINTIQLAMSDKWLCIPIDPTWRIKDRIRHSSSVDLINMILYIFYENYPYIHVFNINLNTKVITKSKVELLGGSYGQTMFIDNKFHIFSGWIYTHRIWDNVMKRLNKVSVLALTIPIDQPLCIQHLEDRY